MTPAWWSSNATRDPPRVSVLRGADSAAVQLPPINLRRHTFPAFERSRKARDLRKTQEVCHLSERELVVTDKTLRQLPPGFFENFPVRGFFIAEPAPECAQAYVEGLGNALLGQGAGEPFIDQFISRNPDFSPTHLIVGPPCFTMSLWQNEQRRVGDGNETGDAVVWFS